LDSRQIRKILTECKTIAVVGLSPDPEKASNQVAAYMKKHGYRIVPVNPFIDEVLGEKSYPSLLEIPCEIQSEICLVAIFRRPEAVPPIMEQAIKLRKAKGKPWVVWMHEGVVNDNAASAGQEAGMTVVMDKCMMQEHKRLLGKRS
jgi:predicted CoA-binding protein